MKYYENNIYPIALVLSKDVESVNKEYYDACTGEDEDIYQRPSVEASCYMLARRTKDYHAMAVGIIFRTDKITSKLKAHEMLHATRFMMEIGVNIPLTDSSEEAWAYLQGWIAECLDDFLNN